MADVSPGWQRLLTAHRDRLNALLAQARAAGAAPETLRSGVSELGPAVEHLALSLPAPAVDAAVPVLVRVMAQLAVRRLWHDGAAERWALLGVVPFVPKTLGRSPEATVDSVVHGAGRIARGSDLAGWGRRLAAADALLRSDEELRQAATVAAWRSGLVRARRAALASGLSSAVLGPLLDLPPGEDPAEVLARNVADPFDWPGRPEAGVVASYGGFRGFGGTWSGLPVVAAPVAASTPSWRLRADDEWWTLLADVHGHALLRDAEVAAGHRPTGVVDAGLVRHVTDHVPWRDELTGAQLASAPGAPLILVSRRTSYRVDLLRSAPTSAGPSVRTQP